MKRSCDEAPSVGKHLRHLPAVELTHEFGFEMRKMAQTAVGLRCREDAVMLVARKRRQAQLLASSPASLHAEEMIGRWR